MEEIRSFETHVSVYKTTQELNLEDHDRHFHSRESL
jgi:hypothetical protein